ncbi:MAG TPA: hypothetical protein VG099_28095, partial [Gemmataceae bacterium]|nr:hypothetical protein [Gemmataceae bacterium]
MKASGCVDWAASVGDARFKDRFYPRLDLSPARNVGAGKNVPGSVSSVYMGSFGFPFSKQGETVKGVIFFRIPALLAITVGLGAVVCARVQGGTGDTGPAPVRDAETAKRFPTKEPVYQSKGPKYCLLTFGREGKTRVWLVFDSVPNPLLP